MGKEASLFVHFVFAFDASSSLHSVIAIHFFCIIFSCILSPSVLNQLLSKLTKPSLFNDSLNEILFTVSVITLLVLLWTFLLLLYLLQGAGKQKCVYYCDVLHFKIFLQDDLAFKGFQLHETGLWTTKFLEFSFCEYNGDTQAAITVLQQTTSFRSVPSAHFLLS